MSVDNEVMMNADKKIPFEKLEDQLKFYESYNMVPLN